jgi:hypothetical protein
VGASLCAYAAEAVGDRDAGAVLYDLLLPFNDFWVCAGMPADCVGPGTWATGLAAAAAGRLDEADRLLTSASEASRARGGLPAASYTEISLARVLLRKGEIERAHEVVARCLVACDELGMPAMRARAEAVLSDE